VFLQAQSHGSLWNATRDQSMEMSKDFERNCPGVRISLSQQMADIDAQSGINKHNVGRIAERIVLNELGFREFRVSDLNKEGISANADLPAAKTGKTWQIQVKGATEDNGWWFGYGYCTDAIIAGKGKEEGRMFNRCSTSSFYKAEIVMLVSVKSPREYSCLVLPVEIAEKASQVNLDREYRTPKKDGTPKKPVLCGYRLIGLLPRQRMLLKGVCSRWIGNSSFLIGTSGTF
jgi:hypothetical protein